MFAADRPVFVGYLWLLRDVKAGVPRSDADEPLSWRRGGGGVGCTTNTQARY